jgi:hypothetical protein
MKQRLIRSAGGLLAGALVLLLVAGPSTAAFAHVGRHHGVVSVQLASGERPGFGDRIMRASAERPGFGDRIQPASRSVDPAAPAAATVAERGGGWSSTTSVALLAGITLAAGTFALVLTAVRRRHRLAQA